jgi:hypothetical protein
VKIKIFTYAILKKGGALQVSYTRLRITNEAARWWKSKKELLQIELGHRAVIPWDRFVEEFNGRFFPRAQR